MYKHQNELHKITQSTVFLLFTADHCCQLLRCTHQALLG